MLVINNVDISRICPKTINPRLIDAGFIIVSACRDERVDCEQMQINSSLNEDLKASIQFSKYADVCVWARYDDGDERLHGRRGEPSYIVFNSKSPKIKKSSERQADSLELKQLGETWCKMFDQEGYYYKEEGPSGEGQYIDGTGKVIQTFNENRPLQAADLYFGLRNINDGETTDLTYVKGEIWIARPDWATCERMMRCGEIYID